MADAVYVRATPGTNAPKLAWPIVSDSVAGTVPPDGAGLLRLPEHRRLHGGRVALEVGAIHFSVTPGAATTGSGSARARGGLYSVDAVVGVEPSVV